MAPGSEASLDVQVFGREVRNLRTAQGWSQERLAEVADLNRTYVGEIERGSAIPSIHSASKLANALGVRLSALLQRCESTCRREA